jgi:hypothetical protein
MIRLILHIQHSHRPQTRPWRNGNPFTSRQSRCHMVKIGESALVPLSWLAIFLTVGEIKQIDK